MFQLSNFFRGCSCELLGGYTPFGVEEYLGLGGGVLVNTEWEFWGKNPNGNDDKIVRNQRMSRKRGFRNKKKGLNAAK